MPSGKRVAGSTGLTLGLVPITPGAKMMGPKGLDTVDTTVGAIDGGRVTDAGGAPVGAGDGSRVTVAAGDGGRVFVAKARDARAVAAGGDCTLVTWAMPVG